jgi:XTP/dITP diphosphohydrolase
MRICFATNNPHKVREVQSLLGSEFELVTLKQLGVKDQLREDGMTLEENSLQKATGIFQRFHIPCFADDSGLFVRALNGAPGVDSAHYAGTQRSYTDNVRLLLTNLAGKTDRQSQFETVITFTSAKVTQTFNGIIKGQIIEVPRGTNGFGYDPIFIPDGCNKTFAEMDDVEKNSISHRALAVQKLVEFLKFSDLQSFV